MRRSFHLMRLLVVFVALGVLGGALLAVNRIQVGRQASVIKAVALKSEAGINGDKDKRAETLAIYEKYIRFQPTDAEAVTRYVKLLLEQYRAVPSPSTVAATTKGLEDCLRKFPDNPELRRELADLYLKTGRPANADQHLEFLLKDFKGDAKTKVEILELRALCEFAKSDLAKAVERLEEAIIVGQDGDVPLSLRIRVYEQTLKWLQQTTTDPVQKNQKVATHLRVLLGDAPFKTNLEARIAVARFEMASGRVHLARPHVAEALRLAGDKPNADALLTAAELELAEARLAEGRDAKRAKLVLASELLKKAKAADPKNVSVGLFLSDVFNRLGDNAGAIAVLKTTAESLGSTDDQFRAVIDHLIDLGDQKLPEELITRLATDGSERFQLAYFRGRLAVLKGDWPQARLLLEEAAPNLARLPEFHKRAMVGLARVYDVLQNPDQQLSCYESALRDDALYGPALIGEAEALNKLGKVDKALEKYHLLVTRFQASGLRPVYARLRLIDILRRPAEARNWDPFSANESGSLVATIGPVDERSDEIVITYAQALAAQGERAKAVEQLQKILDKKPESLLAAVAWVNLARIRESGRPEAALAVLDDAQKQVGDSVDLRLARADVLVFRAKPPAVAEFELLAAKPVAPAKDFLPADWYRLWLGLGQASIAAAPRWGDVEIRRAMFDAAIRFLREAAKAETRDMHSRAILIDLAVNAGKKDVVEETLRELAGLEGLDGPISSLAQIVISMPEVGKITDKATRAARIKDMRDLIAKVQKQRPRWGRVYVALGKLDEMEGFPERAVGNYTRALDEGDRDEEIIRRTVDIHRERKQDAAAAAVLDRLATKMTLPDDLERFRAITAMLSRGSIAKDELPNINRIAPETSKDPKLLMLRGSLLAAIGEDPKALEAFRSAVNIKFPPAPETYNALVSQLVRTRQGADAVLALAEAEKNLRLKLPDAAPERADLFLTLARMHEIVGDAKTAGLRYVEALQAAPNILTPNQRSVEFLMRSGNTAEAEKMLLALEKNPGQDIARWARRYLGAVVMMSRPNPYKHRGEALALLEKNLASVSPPESEDIKARAVIWTIDPVTRNEGTRVLREYFENGALTPDEAYLLARLTFDLGPAKVPESEKYFLYAARPRPGATLEHLAALVRFYASQNSLGAASSKLQILQSIAPYSWEAAREEARLLAKQGQRATREDTKRYTDQARALILKFPGYDTIESIRYRTGPLFEEIGMNTEAEVLYKKLEKEWDDPQSHLPLALLYLRQKKATEVLALAREREAKASVLLTAQLLTEAARAKRQDPAATKQIADWLDGKIQAYQGKPELPGLLGAKAVLYDAQGQYKEAIEEYRRAVKQWNGEPGGDGTVNNLAMLLALSKEPALVDEAIRMMSDLIAIRGPAPTFLDTRAVAYLVKGGDDADKARQDLEMALLQRVRPAYLFHIAWALDLQGKRNEAEKKLDEARKLDLSPDDVHPLELQKYTQLVGPIRK